MNTIKVQDPRTAVRAEDEKLHTVLQGGLRYQHKVLPSTSWGSPNQTPTTANFVYNSNSTKNIVDRFFRVRAYLKVECSTGPFLVGQHDALRQFPLASIMENIVCQINQESISDRVADKVHALHCFGPKKYASNSVSPDYPDSYQEYDDWQTFGSAKNPLALYGESDGLQDHRGGFPIVLAQDGKSFTCEVTEPLFLSPFYNGHGDQVEGFTNINEVNITITWLSRIARVISHSTGGNALGTVSVSMYQAPELLITEITPDLTQPRLLAQSLPYNKLSQFPLSQPVIPAGETITMSSESFKLSQIPSCMWVFARHKRQTSDESTSDSFCGLKNLRLTWNTETLFSSATQQDLYEMSVRNGLNLTWPEFSKYRGSPICLSFGDQVGLIDGEAPGVRGQYTLRVEVDAENLSSADFDPELFVVFNYTGSFTLMENTASAKVGLLTPEDVLASSQSMVEMPYENWKDLQGSGFWSSLKNIVSKVSSGVSAGADIASKVLPELGVGSQYLPAISKAGKVAGIVGKATGGGFTGGGFTGGRLSGRGLVGGSRPMVGRGGAGQYHPQYGSMLM